MAKTIDEQVARITGSKRSLTDAAFAGYVRGVLLAVARDQRERDAWVCENLVFSGDPDDTLDAAAAAIRSSLVGE